MEEMLEEVMQMEDDEELEEEADAEVEKVLYEITDGKLGAAGTVKDELPVGVSFCILFRCHTDLTQGCCGHCGGAAARKEFGAVSEAAERVIEWLTNRHGHSKSVIIYINFLTIIITLNSVFNCAKSLTMDISLIYNS